MLGMLGCWPQRLATITSQHAGVRPRINFHIEAFLSHMFDLEDKKTQQELARMMNPSTRAAICAIPGRLDLVRANPGAALLQQEARSAPVDDDGSSDEDR